MNAYISRLNRSLAVSALFLGVLTLFSGEASEGLPLFQGMVDDAKAPQFGLSNAEKTRIAWVKIGQSFGGWKLEEYRQGADILVLSKDGRRCEINLALAGADTRLSEKLQDAAGEVSEEAVYAFMQAVNFEEFSERVLSSYRNVRMKRFIEELEKRGVRFSELPKERRNALVREYDAANNAVFSKELLSSVFAEAVTQNYSQEALGKEIRFWASEKGKQTLAELNDGPKTMKAYYQNEDARGLGNVISQMHKALRPRVEKLEQTLIHMADSAVSQGSE